MSTVKRVFFYLLSAISLGFFANGAQTVLRQLFNLGQTDAFRGFDGLGFSLGVASFIIGGLIWWLIWRATQREVAGHPSETGSGLRKFYLNVILLVSAMQGIGSTAAVLGWILGGFMLSEIVSAELATMIVAAVVWFYHNRVESREGQPSPAAKTLRRWYVYILAVFTLTMFATSLVNWISNAVVQLPVWGDETISSRFWNLATRDYIAWTVIGGLAWWLVWFKLARDDFDSTLRRVYLYLVTIAGGAVTTITALTVFLYNMFRFFFGISIPAERHFLFLGWTVPTVLVGTAIWMYHQTKVQEEAGDSPERQKSSRRVYLYLMSFIGLGTLVTGLAFLLDLFTGLILNATVSTATLVTEGWWNSELSISLALIIVGTPVWVYYWRKILGLISDGGIAEQGATSRRVYLYAVLGIGIVAATADLVLIVYELVSGVIEGESARELLDSLSWLLQLAVVVVPVLLYHRRSLREDQESGAERYGQKKKVSVLAGEHGHELASQLAERLGYRIRVLRLSAESSDASPIPAVETLDGLADEIRNTEGTSVLVIFSGGTANVMSYEE